MRRTKIVATIGPASRELKILRALIEAGTDVVRLNFSHGKPADHARIIQRVRRLSRTLDITGFCNNAAHNAGEQ